MTPAFLLRAKGGPEPSGDFLAGWSLATAAVGLGGEAEEESVWMLVGCIQ